MHGFRVLVLVAVTTVFVASVPSIALGAVEIEPAHAFSGAGSTLLTVPSSTQVIVGVTRLTSVACFDSASCVSVGENSNEGVVVPMSNGRPGEVWVVAGANSLGVVTCPSATLCVAVGDSTTGGLSGGVVVPIRHGTPARAQRVPGVASLEDVACYSTTSCVAVGHQNGEVGGNGVLVRITNGVIEPAQTIRGSVWLTSIACSSPTACVAVGAQSAGLGVVVRVNDGLAGAPRLVKKPMFLEGVACPSPDTCIAAGYGGAGYGGFILPITDGTPGSVEAVLGTIAVLRVACSSVKFCVALGGDRANQEIVVPITNGALGNVHKVPGVYSPAEVVCTKAISCSTVGTDTSGEGVVVPISDGVPGGPQGVPGSRSLDGLACPSTSFCQTVGSDGSDQGVAATANPSNCVTSVSFGLYTAVASQSCLIKSGTIYTNSGPVALNGLEITPRTGIVKIGTAPGQGSLYADNAEVSIGRFMVYSGPVPTISLAASFSLRAGARGFFAGLPVEGDLTLRASSGGGLHIDAKAGLPRDLGGSSVAVSIDLAGSRTITSAELSADHISIHVVNEEIGLTELSLSYHSAGDTWSGRATVGLPTPDGTQLSGDISIAEGHVTQFGASIENADLALGPDGIVLDSAGLKIVAAPAPPSIKGTIGVTAGPPIPLGAHDYPAVGIHGSVKYIFQQS